MTSADDRFDLYPELHKGLLSDLERLNVLSARSVFGRLFPLISPKSVLDVGCGIGTWLQVAQELGASDISGVEGDWADETSFRIDPKLIHRCDLEKPFDVGRRFDLVMSIEVGEHLSGAAAQGFVESLTKHGDVVLFSAAIPYQGGEHHVNEQYLPYWIERLASQGYTAIDLLRPMLWDDPRIPVWLCQNLVLFANAKALEDHPALSEEAQKYSVVPVSLVHPKVYQSRVEQRWESAEADTRAELAALRGFKQAFGKGGNFTVVVNEKGDITVYRRDG